MKNMHPCRIHVLEWYIISMKFPQSYSEQKYIIVLPWLSEDYRRVMSHIKVVTTINCQFKVENQFLSNWIYILTPPCSDLSMESCSGPLRGLCILLNKTWNRNYRVVIYWQANELLVTFFFNSSNNSCFVRAPVLLLPSICHTNKMYLSNIISMTSISFNESPVNNVIFVTILMIQKLK